MKRTNLNHRYLKKKSMSCLDSQISSDLMNKPLIISRVYYDI